jgi:hypothetical protein
MQELNISTAILLYHCGLLGCLYHHAAGRGYVLDILGKIGYAVFATMGRSSVAQQRWQVAGAVWRWRAVPLVQQKLL